jgi:hypothetical protein
VSVKTKCASDHGDGYQDEFLLDTVIRGRTYVRSSTSPDTGVDQRRS